MLTTLHFSGASYDIDNVFFFLGFGALTNISFSSHLMRNNIFFKIEPYRTKTKLV